MVFRKKHEILKIAKVAVLLSNETERLKSLKIFKIYVLWMRIAAFSEKKLKLFKNPKGSKIAVKCDWNSQICQNVKNMVLS